MGHRHHALGHSEVGDAGLPLELFGNSVALEGDLLEGKPADSVQSCQ